MAKRGEHYDTRAAKRQKTDNETDDKQDEEDDFKWEDGFTDLQLKVEGKLISLNRGFLMAVSPVFKKMFQSDFKEKGAKVVDLPGKKYVEMTEFLRFLLQGDNQKLTEENVNFLLPLASEYQTLFLMARCEDYLVRHYFGSKSVKASRSDLLRLLHIGIRFHRQRLETKAIEHLIRFRMDDIEEDEYFWELSREYQFELYERRVKLVDSSFDDTSSFTALSSLKPVML